MSDDLEKFLAEREALSANARKQKEKETADVQFLRQNVRAEWDRLKTLVKGATGKKIYGQEFKWTGDALILGPVAATISVRTSSDGTPSLAHVTFGRNPYGHFFDEQIIDRETWTVQAIADDQQIRFIKEGVPLSVEAVADAVPKALVIYYEQYEASYGRNA
jgi:hypothetical protein